MSTSNVSTSLNPVISARQQLLSEKERLMKEEMLLDEYEKTQMAYQAMSDAAQVFEQKKAEYLQEESQYETLGKSITMTQPVTAGNPASLTPNPLANPNTGVNAQAQGVPSTAPTAPAAGPLPIEANFNPNAAAYYGPGGPGYGTNAPLPGEGMPYYQPLPNASAPNTPPSSGVGPTAGAPTPQGVPTQASLQQQAQQTPVTPADVAALRQILQMNPQTAPQAAQISDADLTKLLQSDPEIAGAVKEFQAISSGATAPAGPAGQPTDPAQALKLAQQNPEVMKQAQAMVASLSPQEREAMMKQLASDPEAQAILAQMGVSLPVQGGPTQPTPTPGTPVPAPKA
jgi:hypothetical protein